MKCCIFPNIPDLEAILQRAETSPNNITQYTIEATSGSRGGCPEVGQRIIQYLFELRSQTGLSACILWWYGAWLGSLAGLGQQLPPEKCPHETVHPQGHLIFMGSQEPQPRRHRPDALEDSCRWQDELTSSLSAEYLKWVSWCSCACSAQ